MTRQDVQQQYEQWDSDEQSHAQIVAWNHSGGNMGVLTQDEGNLRVGINNATPLYPLHVGAGADTLVRTEASISVQVAGTATIDARDATGNSEIYMIASGSSGFVGTATNHPLHILTNNSTKMSVLADGKVGIGISIPAVKLDVDSDGASNAIRGSAYGSGLQSILALLVTRGTQASPTATQSGDNVGEIDFQGWDTARSTGAQIRGVASANWGTSGDTSDTPTDLIFATATDGSDVLVDRLVIASDGNLGVGVADPDYLLDMAKDGSPVIRAFSYGTSVEADLILGHARGAQASPTATQVDDILGTISFQGWSTSRQAGAKIQAVAAEAWGQGSEAQDVPTELLFSVGPDTAPGAPALTMAISELLVEVFGNLNVTGSAEIATNLSVGEDIQAESIIAEQFLKSWVGLRVFTGNDPDVTLETPGTIAIVSELADITWHNTSGDLKGRLSIDGITLEDVGFRIETNNGILSLADLTTDGYAGFGLLEAGVPENQLHVGGRGSGGQNKGGFIFGSGVVNANPHTFLSGDHYSAEINKVFHGWAIVSRDGGAFVATGITVIDGTPIAVTPDTGHTVTFTVSSNALVASRTAGSGSYEVQLVGVFL